MKLYRYIHTPRQVTMAHLSFHFCILFSYINIVQHRLIIVNFKQIVYKQPRLIWLEAQKQNLA